MYKCLAVSIYITLNVAYRCLTLRNGHQQPDEQHGLERNIAGSEPLALPRDGPGREERVVRVGINTVERY